MNYIAKFRRLIRDHRLDGLVIYSSVRSDAVFKAVVGQQSVLEDYIVVTKKQVVVIQPRFVAVDTRMRVNLKVIDATSELLLGEPLKLLFNKGSKLGIVGNCRYKDIVALEPRDVKDVTEDAGKIISYKSDEYINNLNVVCSDTAEIISNLNIKKGLFQKNIARQIKSRVVKRNYELSFPICITSGNDLGLSTSLMPVDKEIAENDAVCVDMGIGSKNFTTDITRMYFVGKSPLRKIYKYLENVHLDIINEFLSPNKTFFEIIQEYERRVLKYRLIKSVLNTSFGHGIGFGLHEYPRLRNAQGKIGTNIVFTIEPTIVTDYGRIRREDMVGILSDGKVIHLTKQI